MTTYNEAFNDGYEQALEEMGLVVDDREDYVEEGLYDLDDFDPAYEEYDAYMEGYYTAMEDAAARAAGINHLRNRTGRRDPSKPYQEEAYGKKRFTRSGLAPSEKAREYYVNSIKRDRGYNFVDKHGVQTGEKSTNRARIRGELQDKISGNTVDSSRQNKIKRGADAQYNETKEMPMRVRKMYDRTGPLGKSPEQNRKEQALTRRNKGIMAPIKPPSKRSVTPGT